VGRPTCETANDCCSARCVSESGSMGCQALGGCLTSGPTQTQTPTGTALNEFGEFCTDNAQCCSGLCNPDPAGERRCQKQGNPDCGDPSRVCLPRGELCDSDCECCDGTVCREARPPDAFGPFPKRCVSPGPDCLQDGALCGDPGECCGGPCSLHSEGVFRCGVS
jgi:hypothetical protein